jgi:tetratricopeptide (TPR) repeat protein
MRDLAVCHRHFAGLEAARGRKDKALAELHQARQLLEKAVRADPAQTLLRFDLATVLTIQGERLREKKPREALDCFARARACCEHLVRKDPGNLAARGNLATAHERLAVLHRRAGRLNEALTSFRAVAMQLEEFRRRKPDAGKRRELADTLVTVAEVLTRLGRYDEAVQSCRRAVATARAARKRLRSNAELAPLRGRADFQALLRPATRR